MLTREIEKEKKKAENAVCRLKYYSLLEMQTI